MLSHAVIKRKMKTKSFQIGNDESVQSKLDEEWIPIDDLVREIANKKRAETSKERFKRRSNHDGGKLLH